mmetsp:Transcript_7584/g.12407  ORF Transcript_7584/g.12407 Transcript_7584/m.12407 type:complete len:269 (-) Transcript_7584:2253-3059(-)
MLFQLGFPLHCTRNKAQFTTKRSRHCMHFGRMTVSIICDIFDIRVILTIHIHHMFRMHLQWLLCRRHHSPVSRLIPLLSTPSFTLRLIRQHFNNGVLIDCFITFQCLMHRLFVHKLHISKPLQFMSSGLLLLRQSNLSDFTALFQHGSDTLFCLFLTPKARQTANVHGLCIIVFIAIVLHIEHFALNAFAIQLSNALFRILLVPVFNVADSTQFAPVFGVLVNRQFHGFNLAKLAKQRMQIFSVHSFPEIVDKDSAFFFASFLFHSNE